MSPSFSQGYSEPMHLSFNSEDCQVRFMMKYGKWNLIIIHKFGEDKEGDISVFCFVFKEEHWKEFKKNEIIVNIFLTSKRYKSNGYV